ncbi:hypothetical protein QQG55_47250 [Brugia pahangi]|uniref:Uncharacterized protein n=1 Tax=Brugia pahangi TaxID=6280 RepID=A0A0N4SWJ3_BRUPA|nr:unnamed protein product [Brugia pahangi]
MTACSCSLKKGNAAMERCNDNFFSVLRQIESETQRDLKRQHLLSERLHALQEPKRYENPLQYQLIPQRYRMKHNGYAVCRPCAEHSRHHCVPLFTNFNRFDYYGEDSPEHSARLTLNNDECYLTVELGCCLARITHLMFTSVKALKELKFVSGNMYPMISNDITYLNGLYLRMKSNYMQYRTLRMKQMAEDNTIGDVKLLQKSENANDEVHCDLPEDTINEVNGRYFEVGSHKILNMSNSERDFEQYETRKQRFHIGSKWKRDE